MINGHNEQGELERAEIGAVAGLEFASGARMSYEYELNSTPEGEQGVGLRVQQITEDPYDMPARVTQYNYLEPTMCNQPIRISQNSRNRYYKNLEQRVIATTGPQNGLIPNKNNQVGYQLVEEVFPGVGSAKHYCNI